VKKHPKLETFHNHHTDLDLKEAVLEWAHHRHVLLQSAFCPVPSPSSESLPLESYDLIIIINLPYNGTPGLLLYLFITHDMPPAAPSEITVKSILEAKSDTLKWWIVQANEVAKLSGLKNPLTKAGRKLDLQQKIADHYGLDLSVNAVASSPKKEPPTLKKEIQRKQWAHLRELGTEWKRSLDCSKPFLLCTGQEGTYRHFAVPPHSTERLSGLQKTLNACLPTWRRASERSSTCNRPLEGFSRAPESER
jgi:hypothetical protein